MNADSPDPSEALDSPARQDSPDSPELPEATVSEPLPDDDGWIEVTPARRPPPSPEERRELPRGEPGFPVGFALVLLAVVAAGGLALTRVHSAGTVRETSGTQSAALESIESAEPAPAVEMPPSAIHPLESPALQEQLGRSSRWMNNLADAEAESRRTGKPILVEFNAGWSAPSRAMRAEVFEDPTMGDLVRRLVVPVSIVDRSRDNGSNSPEVEELLQNYSIDAFPTLIVYQPSKRQVLRTTGFTGPERTLDWIRSAASSVR